MAFNGLARTNPQLGSAYFGKDNDDISGDSDGEEDKESLDRTNKHKDEEYFSPLDEVI